MIPLALVAGFLGSGKTTFLRHVSKRNNGRRLAFLVNDFAAVDVDAQLLSDLDGEIVSIPGGSVFCRCLTTTFTHALKKILRLEPPVEGVIIEASGMADPRCLADLLRETRLDREFEITAVVALADPGTLPKLLKTLPAVRAQIECADAVLLNKTDLFDEAAIVKAENEIRGVRGDAPILRCARGEAAVDFFHGVSRACKIHAAPAPCRDASFLSATHRFQGSRDVAAVASLLDRHAGILWRAKGFVPTPAGMMELQWTLRPEDTGRIEIQPAKNKGATPALVLIARGDADAGLAALMNTLKEPGT
ncbi:MAG: GTP-binding protein [Kiritimatiellaeota bacterium]|nr:GTP-binding protein [Kiritimatiellota bacterium]